MLLTIFRLEAVGYSTVALSQGVSGKLPPNLAPPSLPSNVPKSLQLLTRITVTLSDPSQNYRLNKLTQAYSLVALRPTTEKSWLHACTNLDCDLISIDCSVRLPFYFKLKPVSAAISRGIRFEICYGPGVTGSGMESRRNLIGNAMALIRATRSRGIIVSSEARRALTVRAPMDVVNLACVWGLSQERGKEAVCEEARKVVALASLKRTSFRGVIDIVSRGEHKQATTATTATTTKRTSVQQTTVQQTTVQQTTVQQTTVQQTTVRQTTDQPTTAAQTPTSETDHVPEKLKRKASTTQTETQSAESEKPVSKRELKRRAKRARLQANGVPEA
jgi:ribonuclease P/MRP protein subunit RPP1